jgi:hypothetical protein
MDTRDAVDNAPGKTASLWRGLPETSQFELSVRHNSRPLDPNQVRYQAALLPAATDVQSVTTQVKVRVYSKIWVLNLGELLARNHS